MQQRKGWRHEVPQAVRTCQADRWGGRRQRGLLCVYAVVSSWALRAGPWLRRLGAVSKGVHALGLECGTADRW